MRIIIGIERLEEYYAYIACITYSRDGNASLIRSEGLALISHTQVMLSCISFIGGFLIFPGALVITPPQRDLSKRRKKRDSKTVQDHASQHDTQAEERFTRPHP